MIDEMQYSKSGLTITEGFEGCKLAAYLDSGGVPTIGFGHTDNVQLGQTITFAQAVAFLEVDIQVAVNAVNGLVLVELSQGEFDALVDFTFNCGIYAFTHSTMLGLINACKFDAAALEFEKWDHVAGVVVAGLLRRRKAEEAEFNAH